MDTADRRAVYRIPAALLSNSASRGGDRLLVAAVFAALTAALALVLAPDAFAGVITPETGGSPNADKISTLYEIILYLAIAVFLGVEGVLIYSIIKFRSSKHKVAAQIHGNTRLEIGWTAGAAVIVAAIATITLLFLDDIKTPPKSGPNGLGAFVAQASGKPPNNDGMTVIVKGSQYLWMYAYANGARSYEEMVVPTDTTVKLKIRSADVAHSWWIPQLGGKFDAIPGYTNETWFKIAKPGVYQGQCAELCGRNHANMIATVRAVSPPEYIKWVRRQKINLAKANAAQAVQKKFFQPDAPKPPAAETP